MKANKERLLKDVEYLTSIFPYRNYQNLESLNTAADYIQNEFLKTGLETTTQSWIAKENPYKNVIASYQPEKKKRLILGAHYDVYGNQPGADDNASGVAGLLETARLIAGHRPLIDYRIDFVAYSLEEPPFFGKKAMGSYIHAKSLLNEGVDVMGMVSYEMIGYYNRVSDPNKFFPQDIILELPDSGPFVGVISIHKYHEFHRTFYELMKNADPSRAGFVSFPNDHRGASLSDNRNYWHFGYPAIMLNSGPSSGRNPNYHQKTDTMDTLDFDVMTEVVSAIAQAAVRFPIDKK